jgi:hypothetical protein
MSVFSKLVGWVRSSDTLDKFKVADTTPTERTVFDSDGYLYQRDTKLTATGAEVNKLASVTAGTVSASKAVVVGTDKNIDTLTLPVSGLRLSSSVGSTGVAVTASAAEINTLTSVTAGTAAASKAAVLGADKNLDTLTLPVSGLRLSSSVGSTGVAIARTAAELNNLQKAVSAATTSANIDNYTRVSIGSTSAAQTFTLAAPVLGATVEVLCVGVVASTTPHIVNAGTGATFDGTNANASVTAIGDTLKLVGISATRWATVATTGITLST